MSRHAADHAPLYVYDGTSKPNLRDKREVWKLEEKRTDVDLGVQMYRGASSDEVDQIVLCTMDSDLAPALEYIKQDFPSIVVGLVATSRHRKDANRRMPKSLTDQANWTRSYLRDEDLERAQLPRNISGGRGRPNKKPIKKPARWGSISG